MYQSDRKARKAGAVRLQNPMNAQKSLCVCASIHQVRVGLALCMALSGASVTALSGCGSAHGGSADGGPTSVGSAATRASGGVQMTIRWPELTRLIPDAAQSIRVDIVQGAATVATKLVPRPAAGQTETTVNFTAIPVGAITINARALPTADGQGTPLASGSTTVTVVANESVTAPALVMGSTIAELRLAPAESLALTVGVSKSFTVTAYNASGEMVLTAPGKIRFSLLGAAAILSGETDDDSAATLTGISPGSSLLTIIELESGKTLTATVTVAARVVRIVDLGQAAGGSSFGRALSSGADESHIFVAGRESPPSLAEIAVAYAGGSFYNLGTLGESNSGALANDVNASGTFVGTSNSQNLFDAIPYRFRDANNNRQADAGELVSLGFSGEAEAINDAGVVVGVQTDSSGRRTSGFVHNNGATLTLDGLGGGRSHAMDINPGGVVAGSAALANGETHAATWSPSGGGYGAPVDLGTLSGSASSVAVAINAGGTVIGYSLIPDPQASGFVLPRAFVATPGGAMLALPLLHATDRASEAFGINASGVIVGRINTATTSGQVTNVAVAWAPDASGNYQVVDLNTLHSTGWRLSSAEDINDQGVITGYGLNPSSRQRGYLLIP